MLCIYEDLAGPTPGDGIEYMAQFIALGEILWDVYWDGTRTFGGAPANFACSIAGQSASRDQSLILSGVGDDLLGKEALASLKSHGVSTELVQVHSEATGQVAVRLDENGSADYQFAPLSAWDCLDQLPDVATIATQADVLCFGTLGQRHKKSRMTIRQIVAEAKPHCMRLLDLNLRAPFYDDSVMRESLELATVLKLNDSELDVVSQMAGLVGSDISRLQQIASHWQLDCVALTLGEAGAILVKGDTVSRQSVAPAEIVDTIGAGDAFTAALALGLHYRLPLEAVNRHANNVAAFVCGHTGATPALPASMRFPPPANLER